MSACPGNFYDSTDAGLARGLRKRAHTRGSATRVSGLSLETALSSAQVGRGFLQLGQRRRASAWPPEGEQVFGDGHESHALAAHTRQRIKEGEQVFGDGHESHRVAAQPSASQGGNRERCEVRCGIAIARS